MVRWTVTGLKKGAIYAVEGIEIVLKNPNMRKQRFLKVFIYLCTVSFVLFILTKLLIVIPLQIVKGILWLTSDKASHADQALERANRLIHEVVAYLPLCALLFMQYIYPKPLDDLFMESLRYLDEKNPQRPPYASVLAQKKFEKHFWREMHAYLIRSWKKLRIGFVLLLLSTLPRVGQFVFPTAGAYTSYRALGRTQAVAVGICFFFLPQRATMELVRALIGMRSLMRELLAPYFIRMNMTHKEKLRWFSGRKDVLFGFSAIAYLMIRIPIVGAVAYGVAQAASAYMLTVVTEPPTLEPASQQSSLDDIPVTDKKND
ncbi:hypothetical protein EDC96DRAFT_552470 [Choanephora cucurbitarum]|nr:hypothetical protein EDC96DRAFT_552470 [Choanephora cucurbitarum]